MKEYEYKMLTSQGLSQRDIADRLNVSQSTVKYYLKKFGLKTINAMHEEVTVIRDHKVCCECRIDKPISEFYKRLGRVDGAQGMCKVCSNTRSIEKQIKMKLKMIEYKGSQCERCNLHIDSAHYSIFEFHHINPRTKDPNFSTIRCRSWQKVRPEIEACQLLCANCHRLVHVGLRLVIK